MCAQSPDQKRGCRAQREEGKSRRLKRKRKVSTSEAQTVRQRKTRRGFKESKRRRGEVTPDEREKMFRRFNKKCTTFPWFISFRRDPIRPTCTATLALRPEAYKTDRRTSGGGLRSHGAARESPADAKPPGRHPLTAIVDGELTKLHLPGSPSYLLERLRTEGSEGAPLLPGGRGFVCFLLIEFSLEGEKSYPLLSRTRGSGL